MMPTAAITTATISSTKTSVTTDPREMRGGASCPFVRVLDASTFMTPSPRASGAVLVRISSEQGSSFAHLVVGVLMHDRWIVAMHKREKDRDKCQRAEGCQQEATNDGAAQGGILFTTFAESECHGHHANDHRKRRHDDWAKTREASGQRCLCRIQAQF